MTTNEVKQALLRKFDREFNFDTVFGTDNFEDYEHISHPCYNHAGVIKAMREDFTSALDDVEKAVREEILKEVEKALGKNEAPIFGNHCDIARGMGRNALRHEIREEIEKIR